MKRKRGDVVGRRVRLIGLADDRLGLRRGALGTVESADDVAIYVEWDGDGRILGLIRGVDRWAYFSVPKRLAGVRRDYQRAVARRRARSVEALAAERGLTLPEGHGWSGEWREGVLVDVVAVPIPGFDLPLPFGESIEVPHEWLDEVDAAAAGDVS